MRQVQVKRCKARVCTRWGSEWATSALPLSFTLTSDPHPLLDLGWDTEGVELRGAVAAQAGLPLRLKVRELKVREQSAAACACMLLIKLLPHA